eukprot:UN18102
MLAVMYSFVTVLAACLGKIILNNSISPWKWGCLFIISLGVVVCSVSQINDNKDFTVETIGVSLAIGCTFCYALIYVMNENIISKETPLKPHLGGVSLTIGATFCNALVYVLNVSLISKETPVENHTSARLLCLVRLYQLCYYILYR